MSSTNEKAWLASLKAGDTAVYKEGGYVTMYAVLTIDRTTPTQFICGSRRFNRDTGCERGGSSFRRLEPLTDQIKAEIEHENLKDWFSRLSCKREPLAAATLRAMKSAFDATSPQAAQP